MNKKKTNRKTVKEMTFSLKDVDPKEVFAGLDAIDVLCDHYDTPWVADFLRAHEIEVEGLA